ncbi:MAG: FAD-dependent oxidoreductase [Clostridia bacterium]|nr:FAD-dependent oxidoreductase [Clostridia bacterium]
MHDIIVIGGGPAGMTAALYAKRAGKSVLLIEKNTFGGQITWSHKVENYPAISSLSGLEWGDQMFSQIEALGVEYELDEVTSITKKDDLFTLTTAFGAIYEAKAIILATGAKPKRLGLEGEEDYIGCGISFCAVCDGEFYRQKDVAIIGGGNTALGEALYLADICRSVTLIVRRDSYRADLPLVDAISKRDNIRQVMSARVSALHGQETLSGVTLTYADGKSELMALDGLFIAIGHSPENELFSGLIALTEDGYANADETCATITPGVFVAGDCRQKQVRQLTTAVSDGTISALAACRYIDHL